MGVTFRTEVKFPPSEWKISHQSKMMAFGSCFAENIGEKLQNAYFQININPFGVLFNPFSVLQSVEYLLNNKTFAEKDIFPYGSLWHSFSHSSKFSATAPEEILKNTNEQLNRARQDFQHADILLFTFGTACVYEFAETGAIVANCHKLPANCFIRRRLTTDEIVENYVSLLEKISEKRHDLKFVFTVSPVRHFKDGAVEN
ncbi:MAG: GSCFA domain-containing protein, partial [Paludibacter sp.]|nr:GSCFA domain-containing protein [Paludibacter sp.]